MKISKPVFPGCNRPWAKQRVALLLLLLTSIAVDAQTVRGTVIERATGLPAAGVVTLERLSADSQVLDSRSVLTRSDGSFSVIASVPGRARLHVRRIGAIPFRSEILSLAAGEIKVVDVRMERVPPRGSTTESALARIQVRGATPCRATDDGAYIATLWDDARTALMATEISAKEDKTLRRSVRYVRELDSPSLKVFAESLHAFDGSDSEAGAFFRSRSGEELSSEGYWYEDSHRAVWFFGPDASALLSETFVRDHCFRLTAEQGSDDGMIRLAFEPVFARTREYSPAEIIGIVKFDAATNELRQLEFDWLRLRADTSLWVARCVSRTTRAASGTYRPGDSECHVKWCSSRAGVRWDDVRRWWKREVWSWTTCRYQASFQARLQGLCATRTGRNSVTRSFASLAVRFGY